MNSLLVDWTDEQFQNLEKVILRAKHRLNDTGLFTDERLIQLIDSHSPKDFSVNTMGDSHLDYQWREGNRNGVPADVLLNLVKTGRLWINLRNMMDNHAEYRELVDSLYDELEANAPDFKAIGRSANLLISSPGALVHYHTDVPVNMLWHIRGRKRVWVYPPFDLRFNPQDLTEDVIAGDTQEDLSFDPSYDDAAQVFDLEPGDLATWPQLTPHRVTNLEGLNVSLSSEHRNATAIRRINVHLANRFLRRRLGLPCRSIDVDGPSAHLKQFVSRIVRRLAKLRGKSSEMTRFPITFKVDPDAPLGYSELFNQQETPEPTTVA